MSKTAAQGETPNHPATIEFLDRAAVLKFFGGSSPLHVSTLYRGIRTAPIQGPCGSAAVRCAGSSPSAKPPHSA